MFALGIRYLNDWAMATHPADRERAEWPPHPDRVFMALAAAHFETGEDAEGRRALEWLETLGPPELAASKAEEREIISTYVPVNDTEIARPSKDSADKLAKRLAKLETINELKLAKEAGLALLPEFRSRQQLAFPVVIPYNPHVYLIWPQMTCPERHIAAIASLCADVTCIGDPSSLVQMWLEDTPPGSTWIPDPNGIRSTVSLRVFGRDRESGRLARLKAHHQLEQNLGRRLRISSDSMRYRAAELPSASAGELPRSVFDPNLIILRRLTGPQLGLHSTLQLTAALRDTVMSQCGVQPPPEWVTGHTSEGLPSTKPHLAFLAVPHVGREHADGHLLGVAIAVPGDVPAQTQQECLGSFLFEQTGGRQGLPQELEIRMGRIGVWKVMMNEGDDPRFAMRPETWTAGPDGAQRWATVTPIVLDRHPKKSGDAEETVAASCECVGLPRPKDVILTSVSMFIGSPHAKQFPNMQRKAGGNLHHTHAILIFDRPVLGPVLLGAGRYRGYGLCRPLREGGAA